VRGTVTISLADYERLRSIERRYERDSYSWRDIAIEQNQLNKKIKEAILSYKKDNVLRGANELLEEIENMIDKFYR